MGSKRYQRLKEVLERRQPDLTVLMERVNKPHNFSAILRNCDAVGILEVHVVPPDTGLRLHNHASGGTARWVGVHHHEDGPSAIRVLRETGYQVLAADPGSGAVDFREPDYTAPTVLLMGAELYGLSDGALREADATIQIPMLGLARSLNVSVATALILYEAYRQRAAAGLYDKSRLDPEHRRNLLFEWTHPELARCLRERGEAYPELDSEGTIRG